jgi:hypothetical protein
LAMTDNLSSKCFAPTDNCTGEAFGELFLAMTDNLSSKCFAPTILIFYQLNIGTFANEY